MQEGTSKGFAKHVSRCRTAIREGNRHHQVTGYFVSAENFEASRRALNAAASVPAKNA